MMHGLLFFFLGIVLLYVAAHAKGDWGNWVLAIAIMLIVPGVAVAASCFMFCLMCGMFGPIGQ